MRSGASPSRTVGLFFTKIMVMIRPMVHRIPETANEMLIPVMLACIESMLPIKEAATKVYTETRIAVPREPETWRKVLFTEVPWFITLLSSAFIAHVVIGMFTKESENIRTV